MLKVGGYVASRESWNGKNMYIYIEKGSYPFLSALALPRRIEGISYILFDLNYRTDSKVRMPHINMVNASEKVIVGWSATQTDMLADDWIIREEVSG